MAEYHIQTDLQKSVNANGCGTLKDWDQIGTWLKTCVDKGVAEDVIPGLQGASGWVASLVIAWDRSSVRTNCVANRTARGLNVEGK